MSESNNDHDLLIKIHTQLERAIDDLNELKKDMAAAKLDKAEAYRLRDAADQVHEDHESRIRRLERWGFGIVGVVAFINILGVAVAIYFAIN